LQAGPAVQGEPGAQDGGMASRHDAAAVPLLNTNITHDYRYLSILSIELALAIEYN